MEEPRTYIRSNTPRNDDIEDIQSREVVSAEIEGKMISMVQCLLAQDFTTKEEVSKFIRKQFKMTPKHSEIIYVLQKHFVTHENRKSLKELLISTKTRSLSGVVVITVLTSPRPKDENGKEQKFSCRWNCYYCPNEPNQPRSYLHDEPAVVRANANSFDPILQFVDRARTLYLKGHDIDKIELIVLGGTWESYPKYYRDIFCRDLFYAANMWDVDRLIKTREPYDALTEQTLNETAQCKVIGLTLETRPDTINESSIMDLRKLGCTRVQLGVQHTDDAILKKINRECTTAQVKNAIQLLKDACYKVDIHLMPNLPGSSQEADRKMFSTILQDPMLQVDQVKIYPCEIVPWTVIKKWYDKGEFVPYSYEDMIDAIIEFKVNIHPWIRINRVIRDIPSQYISNESVPHLRDEILKRMHNNKQICRCIRCREIKDNVVCNPVLVTRKYESSHGTEYFLSFEENNRLIGFLRLRLTHKYTLNDLTNSALIRELHVYGKMIPTFSKTSDSQHMGYGSRLLKEAEKIAFWNGFTKISVISGVGVRPYYRKRGYTHQTEHGFLTKRLIPSVFSIVIFFTCVFFTCVYLYFL